MQYYTINWDMASHMQYLYSRIDIYIYIFTKYVALSTYNYYFHHSYNLYIYVFIYLLCRPVPQNINDSYIHEICCSLHLLF